MLLGMDTSWAWLRSLSVRQRSLLREIEEFPLSLKALSYSYKRGKGLKGICFHPDQVVLKIISRKGEYRSALRIFFILHVYQIPDYPSSVLFGLVTKKNVGSGRLLRTVFSNFAHGNALNRQNEFLKNFYRGFFQNLKTKFWFFNIRHDFSHLCHHLLINSKINCWFFIQLRFSVTFHIKILLY